MDEKTEMLHKICKSLMSELDDYSKKIEKSDGMSAGDLEAIDKLSHALKSVKTTIAMMESEGENGYSGNYPMRYYGADGNTNRSYRGGMSNARGRMNAPRDSRGRYSGNDGYSYNAEMDGVIEEMEQLLPHLPDEKKRKAERLIEELRY